MTAPFFKLVIQKAEIQLYYLELKSICKAIRNILKGDYNPSQLPESKKKNLANKKNKVDTYVLIWIYF